MAKYRGKYRNGTTRAPFWDYGWEGFYFITICTKNRIPWFGKVLNRKMYLSAIGQMVQQEWLKTFELRKDMNLFCGEFVVMPDHFHALIGIGNNPYNADQDFYFLNFGQPNQKPNQAILPKDNGVKSELSKTTPKNQFGPQSNNLASILRGFKSAVTMEARPLEPAFTWQSRYHDRIVRDEEAFYRISRYIRNNPRNWKEETYI